MKNYIFVTPEGLTCKPNIDRPEPEFVDMQIMGFGRDTIVQDALKDLIEMHSYQPENKINALFTLRQENDSKKYIRFKENKREFTPAS
ncbi:MAG: hypothetical protein JXA46_08555 [Dehalococcoidales bacterium]|nr:hypothetical protein [Dehalococcoidales bacterium]